MAVFDVDGRAWPTPQTRRIGAEAAGNTGTVERFFALGQRDQVRKSVDIAPGPRSGRHRHHHHAVSGYAMAGKGLGRELRLLPDTHDAVLADAVACAEILMDDVIEHVLGGGVRDVRIARVGVLDLQMPAHLFPLAQFGFARLGGESVAVLLRDQIGGGLFQHPRSVAPLKHWFTLPDDVLGDADPLEKSAGAAP